MGSDSQLNKSGTGTPEFDAKIAELEQIPDREEQTRKANELEREAFGQYGIMPYANGPQLVASKKTLANFGRPRSPSRRRKILAGPSSRAAGAGLALDAMRAGTGAGMRGFSCTYFHLCIEFKELSW